MRLTASLQIDADGDFLSTYENAEISLSGLAKPDFRHDNRDAGHDARSGRHEMAEYDRRNRPIRRPSTTGGIRRGQRTVSTV